MVSITGKGTRISPYTRAYTPSMFYLSNNDRNFKPACASTSHSVIPILHCEPFRGAVHRDWAALEEITTKQDPTTYGWHVQNNLIERRQISSGTQAWDISVAVASQPRLSHLSSLEQRRGGTGGEGFAAQVSDEDEVQQITRTSDLRRLLDLVSAAEKKGYDPLLYFDILPTKR